MTIYVIAYLEKNERTGKMELITSHGVDSFGRSVCLPSEHPEVLGAKRDPDRGWILEDSLD